MKDNNTMWNSAARSGLILGGICIAYLLANHFLSKLVSAGAGAAVAASIGDSLLWIAKFSICIILMRRFIKNYAAESGADIFEVRGFGRRTALLSALVYSGFYLAYVLYINPTIFTDAVDTIAEAGMMDSSQLDMLDSMTGKLPMLTFFGNLIYCYLFGAVLTLIFSGSISSNPFDEPSVEEEQEEETEQ